MPRLDLTLLGCLRIAVDGEVVRPETRKAEALLVYLALAERPPRRADLGALFWPDTARSKQLGSLRRNLSALRKALGPDALVSDGEQIGLAADWKLAVDVRELAACARRVEALDDEAASRLAARLDAIEDPTLLAGFHPRACPGFELWRNEVNQAVARDFRRGVEALRERAAQAGNADEALAWSRRLLALDPCDERFQRAHLRLLADAGRRAEALAHYRDFASVLEREQGRQPHAATSRLHLEILAAPAPAPTPLPVPAPAGAALIGREEALAAGAAQLRDETCRWLTIKGAAGIGKTALARALLAELVGDFPDGQTWLDAAELPPGRPLEEALCAALGARSLRAALHRRRLLLVLDGLQATPAVAELARAILACKQVTVLATARARLRCQAEWVHELDGLAPDDAAALFLERARATALDFSLPAAQRPALAELCALCGGHPLALSMCAGWVRVLDCAEMVAELRANLAFPHPVDDPEAGLGALFRSSWERLEPAARAALCRLATAPDPISPARLLALADASWLRRDGGALVIEPVFARFVAAEAGSGR